MAPWCFNNWLNISENLKMSSCKTVWLCSRTLLPTALHIMFYNPRIPEVFSRTSHRLHPKSSLCESLPRAQLCINDRIWI